MRLPVFFSAAVLACTSSCARAVNVGTCEEFEAVDRKTETEVTITNSEFTCDEYTRLSIRTDMVLKSSVGAVTFSNLALKVYGSLTVEPDVVFTGISFVVSSVVVSGAAVIGTSVDIVVYCSTYTNIVVRITVVCAASCLFHFRVYLVQYHT